MMRSSSAGGSGLSRTGEGVGIRFRMESKITSKCVRPETAALAGGSSHRERPQRKTQSVREIQVFAPHLLG